MADSNEIPMAVIIADMDGQEKTIERDATDGSIDNGIHQNAVPYGLGADAGM